MSKLSRFPLLYNLLAVPDSGSKTLRWLVAIRGNVALALLCVSVGVLLIPGVETGNIGYIIAICATFVLINAIYNYILNHRSSERVTAVLREIMIPVDVALITVCIYTSGGALSPMIILYSVAILLSTILLNPMGVFRTAAISILLYCGLAFGEAYKIIPYASDYWGGPDLHRDATFTTYALYLVTLASMLLAQAYIGNRIALIINLRNSLISSQMRDLNTVYDITSGLGNVMDEGEIARYLATRLKSLQDASICVVSLLNKENKPEVVASTGLTPAGLAALRNASFGAAGFSNLLERGEPLILEDLNRHPEYGLFVQGNDIDSAYVYPIVDKGRVLGAIGLAFEKSKSLSEEYRGLLTTIANQAGMAVGRARLFNDTQRLAHEMSTLYDIGLHTGSTLSRSEVIKRTANNIEKLLHSDMFYIALYEPATGSINLELCKENGQIMPKVKMSVDHGGLTARIITTREPLLVHDWLEDGQQYNTIAKKMGADMLSYLGVPMMYDGDVVGVLSVQCAEPHAFNRHDQRLLQAMAAQTAMALENARLHQLAQAGAITDSLTQVYNHGHFVELVHEAVAASDKDDSQVSLIMLDIDHFKQYNDLYGHVAGDNVLAMVGEALKESVREECAVGRWGGEEFGILLVGTGLQEAKKVARSIRRRVTELVPVDGHGTALSGPTVSQGISTYPFPSISATHLIEEADAALYHAKEHGRNQLVVSEVAGIMKDATSTSPRLPATVLKNATITTGHLME